MPFGSLPPELDLPPGEAWQEIESALDELALLARNAASRQELHGKLLERLVGMLSAVGGAVWDVTAENRAAIECQLQLDQCLAGDHQEFTRHQRLAEVVAAAGTARLAPPAYRDAEVANASPWLAILCPIAVERQVIAVVEIFQRPDGRAAVEDGYLRLVRTACDLAEEFHRARALERLREQHAELQSLTEFQARIHEHLELTPTSATIVNEARRVLDCDRVTLLVRRGGSIKVVAISGTSTFDRRSGLVLGLESIAKQVLPTGEPLWFPDQADNVPARVAEQVETLLDESHARSVGFVPVGAIGQEEAEPIGLLCVEQFTVAGDAALQRRATALATACGPALEHALRYDNIPLRSALQRAAVFLGWGQGSRWSPALVAAGVLLGSSILLAVIPAELTIEARGQLMPKQRQHVFAPSDGVVMELPRGDGEAVEKGNLLAKLHSPALDIQQSELTGRQRTVQEDLVAAETASLRGELDGIAGQPRGQATAKVEQLKAELRGLDAQLAIVREQQAELDVKSPLTGVVITWDAERQLAGRPVKRGDSLLTVADLTGPWELLLDVPDRTAGHVLAARQGKSELPVTFQLGTDPGNVRRGHVVDISPATELLGEAQPMVRVTAALNEAGSATFRPGATVVARVHCGRRSLGYVWLHEMWEAVRLRLFL